jgi:hypothetical protein
MNQFPVSFQHLYLLVDLHAAPILKNNLSATRFKCAVELQSKGLVELNEGRYRSTLLGDEIINHFGQYLVQKVAEL